MDIIVSLTSWTKRIINVKTVLGSVLKQTLPANLIELNLSLEEFPNKEKDLPVELFEMIQNNKQIEINWVEGNTGVFKKIIPTLQKFYEKEYYLLSIDDDYIYREDYIEIMVKYLETYRGGVDVFALSNAQIIGNRTIYKSSAFKSDFWEKLTKEVIESRIDDAYITYYLNSYKVKCGNYKPDNVNEIVMTYNNIFPNSHNDKTFQYSRMDIIKAENNIKKIHF